MQTNVPGGSVDLRPVSVHDFLPGHSGMSCVRMVVRPDGTGDACGEPVKSAIHDPAAYAAYHSELKVELGKYERREPPYDTPDALDQILESAFPSQPEEVLARQTSPDLATVLDKVRGHLEAARTAMDTAYAQGGRNANSQAEAVYRALKALARDLGL
jgi:hypothetical protein